MLIAQTCNQDISQPGLRFLSAFGDDEKLRTLRQMASMLTAEGFKTFCYPGVGFATRWAMASPAAGIACGFQVMQMFYNPSRA
ncbi:hypothetical protein [Nostoc sp.]